MRNFVFINPKYIEVGQEAAAAEFEEILADTLPAWAADMSEGYAWNDEIPDAESFQNEADELAAHLVREHGE
jgi:hypothetical protein